MKYRLKDEKLQRKLDALSDRDFSKLLGGVEDTGFSALRIPLCGFIEDAGQTIPRVGVYVRREDLEEVCKDTSEELKANIREQINSLRGIFKRIENDLSEDEPVAAEVRVGLAKGLVGSLDLNIKEWMRKKEDEE